MCLCGFPYHDYLCDYHRRQAEYQEGRHAGVCDRMESLAEWRRRNDEGDSDARR